MASTNKTTNFNLPQFVGTDKPTWLSDFNSAMATIDTAVGKNKTDIAALTAALSSGITAAIADAKLAAHPVGSYFWSSVNNSPASLFGGTWTQVKDKFVLAAGDSYSAGSTGGNATNKHNHWTEIGKDGETLYVTNYSSVPRTRVVNASRGTMGSSDIVGSARQDSTYDETIDIMPPYEVAYCWKRTG